MCQQQRSDPACAVIHLVAVVIVVVIAVVVVVLYVTFVYKKFY